MRSKTRSGAQQGRIPEQVRSGPVSGAVPSKAQGELTRVALGPGGRRWWWTGSRRLPGRGAYLCGAGCLTAALKRKAFGRAFRGKAGQVDPLKLGQAWEPGAGVLRGAMGEVGC